MNIEHMNKAHLDRALSGEIVDYLYHFGISSADEIINSMKDLKAIVLGGSPHRITRMAKTWSDKNKKAKLLKFPKDERFTVFYTDGVLFSSHGMGMPSMSIAIQELMKLVYFVKKGDLNEVEKVFWCRVGTSGGVGIEPGSVVISTESVLPDLKPYRVFVAGEEYYFSSKFPEKCIDEIIQASSKENINIVKGKTIGADSFYIEQNRIDGAVAMCDENKKLDWLRKAEKFGVKNIEMETPMMVGLLNHWGFPRFAAICCTLLNRLHGDQINSTVEQLEQYSLNAEKVLWNYLAAR